MTLIEDARPMRALRALATMDLASEEAVATVAALDESEEPWGDVLRTLTERGLVNRSGEAGGYRYAISEAGHRELFGEGSGQAPVEEDEAA